MFIGDATNQVRPLSSEHLSHHRIQSLFVASHYLNNRLTAFWTTRSLAQRAQLPACNVAGQSISAEL